jgi:hypothetical protein
MSPKQTEARVAAARGEPLGLLFEGRTLILPPKKKPAPELSPAAKVALLNAACALLERNSRFAERAVEPRKGDAA